MLFQKPQPCFGRKKIYTLQEKITCDNVVSVLNETLPYHEKNSTAEHYLYCYRRGEQPILCREKKVRPEICNRICENHADEIVCFKNGYFLPEPCNYVSRSEDESVTEQVRRLNEYMYLADKESSDKELADWFHTVGVGIRALLPAKEREYAEAPFRIYTMDPRYAYVVHSYDFGEPVVMGVKYTEDPLSIGSYTFHVYTDSEFFEIRNGCIVEQKPHILTTVPFFEYVASETRMGVFESVLPLLDAINNAMSNRLDSLEQFVQAFMKFTNCDVSAEDFEKLKDLGAIKIKSIDGMPADVDLISKELDQSQIQVLIDYMYQQVLSICGMPSTTKGGTSTSDTGAAVLYRDGWYQADTRAQNTEDLFKKADRRFLKLALHLLRIETRMTLKPSDVELKFVRHATDNLLVKTQAAMNMKQLGFSPEQAFSLSGLSSDPVGDAAKAGQYLKGVWTLAKDEGEESAPKEKEVKQDE